MKVYVLFSAENGTPDAIGVYVTKSQAVKARDQCINTSPYYSKDDVRVYIKESIIAG